MSELDANEVMRSLGRIEAKIDGHTAWMTKHVADDALMADDIQKLQITGARQKGFLTAMAASGAFISGLVGYAIEYLISGRGHS
jgi:hypothetical protein